MASGQVSAPELEEDVKVEEVHEEDVARESEVEKSDVTKPAFEDKEDLFEVEDEVQGEEEGGHGGITEVPAYAGARIIEEDDDDDLDAEGQGAGDEDAIHLQ
ncbi:hypothetical protein MLD38_019437 [Melastoma candidum]|uniref:Uncharacterized protein n=1 Tax=Melastoma candidum TaxID=119954 RepID=A0ACB9QYW0_9MYRT|nr:hypothetical protein MLD38_019437 [Melastoma candidum]